MARLTQDLALWRGTEGFIMPNNVIVFKASGPGSTMRAFVLVAFQDSVLFLPRKRLSYIQFFN